MRIQRIQMRFFSANLMNSISLNNSNFDSQFKHWIDHLEAEGMTREQAHSLLNLLDMHLESYANNLFYQKFVHPQEYNKLVASLRQAHPLLLQEVELLESQSQSHKSAQLKLLESQTNQHRQEFLRALTDIKAGLSLDVNLERKRLVEIENNLESRIQEGQIHGKERVEEAQELLDILWNNTIKGIAGFGGCILTLFIAYKSISH